MAVPPLRARPDDIAPLVAHFVAQFIDVDDLNPGQ